MRALAVLFSALALHAQTVAVVNGKPVTESELEAFKATIPPELRVVMRNPDSLLRYYGFISRMAELAEKSGLADRSPYKEQLAIQRKMLLGQAMQTDYGRDVPITPADEQKYFEQHKDLFQQATVVSLLVPIKSPSEAAAAKAKADDLRKRAVGGADFAELAKQHPGDVTSIRRCDTDSPSIIRDAVFATKAGDITPAVALANGVYVFRVERIVPMPLSEARGYASKAISDERYQTWMNSVNKSVTVEKPAPPK
jgi:parvulin-like peptidyl-prolyl isomerase